MKIKNIIKYALFFSNYLNNINLAVSQTTLPRNPEDLIIKGFDVKHGREVTLTNKYLEYGMYKTGISIDGSFANKKAIEIFKNKIPCLQSNTCTISSFNRRGFKAYEIIYPKLFDNKDWGFLLTLDPGVIELPLAPLTTKQAITIRSILDRDIYDVGEKIYVEKVKNKFFSPLRAGRIGATHDHIDWEVFKENPLLLRNFYVDLQNHPGLALGALESSMKNAPPVVFFSKRSRRNLIKILDEFDKDFKEGKIWSSYKLAQMIQENVQNETYMTSGPLSLAWKPVQKYQMVNLSRIFQDFVPSEQKTIELRFFRASKNSNELILQQALIDHRLHMLYSLNKNKDIKQTILLPFLNKNIPKTSKKTTKWGGTKNIANINEVVGQYYFYVIGAHLDWTYFLQLLPENLQKIAYDLKTVIKYNPYKKSINDYGN